MQKLGHRLGYSLPTGVGTALNFTMGVTETAERDMLLCYRVKQKS